MKVKSSNFAHAFKNYLVLCVDQKAPRYLLTPINAGYLNSFKVMEITTEHEIKMKFEFKTMDIQIRPLDAKGDFNLYEYLSYLKQSQQCSMEF